MGNRSSKPRHVTVKQRLTNGAPTFTLSGFVKDNGYALTYSLTGADATVRDLLGLMNKYRVKPITALELEDGTRIQEGAHLPPLVDTFFVSQK